MNPSKRHNRPTVLSLKTSLVSVRNAMYLVNDLSQIESIPITGGVGTRQSRSSHPEL